MAKYKKLTDTLENSLKVIKDHVIKDCDSKRKFMIPLWKLSGYYWNDIQDIYWDYENNDWSTFDKSVEDASEFDSIRDANNNANVYRADGESLIAAATIGNFAIRYYPENAAEARDIIKARAYSDITEYLQIKNHIKDLRRQALALRYQYGLVAAYTYYETDEKYGTVKFNDVGFKRTLVTNLGCTDCEYEDEKETPEGIEMNLEQMEEYPQDCPECGAEGTVQKRDEYTKERAVNKGEKEEYKGCSKIRLFSPLEIRVPFYAKDPDKIDYIVVQEEMHYSDARAMYGEAMEERYNSDEINPDSVDLEAFDREQLDFWGSLSSDNLVTVTYVWMKPTKYNILPVNKPDDIRELYKEYPKGAVATFIEDKLLKCVGKTIEDHWTFCRSPLDTHVYLRPLGQASIPMQKMTNDLIFIILDTIKHSTGDTWVNVEILNRKIMDTLKQAPGTYIPVFTKDNKPISDHFFSSKSATLSREVDNFFQRLEQLRQHVSGIFPSVFGGRFNGGSQTFGEYKQSRDQALQRISMPADNVDDFLAEAFHKATEMYAAKMHTDESYSVAQGNNNFMNKTLRKPSSKGKIGRIEVVKSEQFPLTWEQQKATLLELMGAKIDPQNPIASAVFSADNMTLGTKLVGLDGFVLPGENDRNKQLMENQRLLDGESMDGVVPSVVTDPQIDNDEVHISTIRSYAVSPDGMYQQKVNPKGFQNMLLHMLEHEQNIQKKMMAQQPVNPEDPNAPNPEGEENLNEPEEEPATV